MQRLWHKIRIELFKYLGIIAFVFYCLWNGYWLFWQKRLAPSIWSYYTGLPNPGSGGTRSLKAAFAGEYMESLLYNPFTFPFILLTVYSFYRIAANWRANKAIELPPYIGWMWIVTIALAWITKFIIGPKYW
ncbi:MAG: DUF2752 domain-containing protein [Clostridiaceae bacterium]|nr:DUF2752 domain-containing protein [Clostridiaceae bacterium]